MNKRQQKNTSDAFLVISNPFRLLFHLFFFGGQKEACTSVYCRIKKEIYNLLWIDDNSK
jgi:hypothetical protein